MNEEIKGSLVQILGEANLLIDEPMSKHTSFRVGGNADYFAMPSNISSLTNLLRFVKKNKIPITFIGNGTNVLVSDKGIRGIVITLKNLSTVVVDSNSQTITAEAGAMLPKVSQMALNNSFTGLEFACGIPATIGGAVYMNAGAYGGEIQNILQKVKYIDLNSFELVEAKKEELKFAHRSSSFQNDINGLIVEATFKLSNGNNEEIKKQMDKNMLSRNTTQPINFPSAGSTFKREEGIIVSKLIDEAGLKGTRVGGAEVSTLHAGFIINSGNATAKDILDLITLVKNTIKEKYNVDIHEEVRVIGEM